MTATELKARREALGLSQHGLARLLDCTAPYVANLEKTTVPQRVADALDAYEASRWDRVT